MMLMLYVFLIFGVVAFENDDDEMRKIELRLEALEKSIQPKELCSELELRIIKLETHIGKPNIQKDAKIAPGEPIGTQKMNESDLEQRVQALEIQMGNVEQEVSDLEEDIEAQIDLTIVQADLSILSQGQLNQDEKIEDLEDVSEGLDTRVTTLEDEDGTDDSIIEAVNQLNADVQYLNGTVGVLANEVENLETTDQDLDSRLETLESQDLESEIDSLDSRLDALELGGTIAFHVGFTDEYPIIPMGAVAVWDYIFVNIGNGYNMVTGDFVVPPGGAGLYYFNVHFLFDAGERQFFDIRHNGNGVCQAYEQKETSGDWGGSACGAVVQLQEGDTVDVYHAGLTDDTPCEGYDDHSTFSGFRIAPQ